MKEEGKNMQVHYKIGTISWYTSIFYKYCMPLGPFCGILQVEPALFCSFHQYIPGFPIYGNGNGALFYDKSYTAKINSAPLKLSTLFLFIKVLEKLNLH